MCFCATLSGNTFYTVSIICSAIAAATTTHPSQNRHKITPAVSPVMPPNSFLAAIVIIRKCKQGRCHRDSSRHERCPHHKADAQDSCAYKQFYHSFMRLIREQIQRPRPALRKGNSPLQHRSALWTGSFRLPPRPASGIP